MLLKFALEAFEQRNSVGSGPRETHNDLVVVQSARLPRAMFHHVIAHGHLTVRNQHHFVVFAHAQHRGPVHLRAS
jgi:hypothetical protein